MEGERLSAWPSGLSSSKPAIHVAGFVLCALLPGCAADRTPEAEPRTTTVFEGEAMGTAYRVTITTSDSTTTDGPRARQGVARVIQAIDDSMTTYRPSQVTRFNELRDTEPFEITREMVEVLQIALDTARVTDGAFDVTVGPLVEAWGFGAERIAGAPDPRRLAQARQHMGYETLELGDTWLRKSDPEVEVDLSGVAKGYAVDRAALALDAMGYSDYLVDIGGEVRAKGANANGTAWRLGIESPDAERGVVQRVVPLADMAMATSGDYRNYREIDGRRVSHLLDPRAGKPIEHRVASVTVLDPECAVADARATALMVLGAEDGLALAEELGWPVLLLLREGDRFVEIESSAFTRLLESVSGVES